MDRATQVEIVSVTLDGVELSVALVILTTTLQQLAIFVCTFFLLNYLFNYCFRLWTEHKLLKPWLLQLFDWYLFMWQPMGSAHLLQLCIWLLWDLMPNAYVTIACNTTCINYFLDCTPDGSCSSHGTCNTNDGSCLCNIEWTGTSCDQCAQNYYPPTVCEICMSSLLILDTNICVLIKIRLRAEY